MKKFHYLGSLLFVFCVPALIAGLYLSNFISLSALLPFILLVTIIGSVWDVWATRHGKKDKVWLWQFNRKQTLGVSFLGLPIEEYLFYVASSIYVIFMWEGLKLMIQGAEYKVYLTMLVVSGWTLACILLPYFLGGKKDKIFG